MNWTLLDCNIWQILIVLNAFVIAYLLMQKQLKTPEVSELYASQLLVDNRNAQGNTISRIPHIAIQNIGTKVIYLDKHTINGQEYISHHQILPPTYSHVQDNFYRIELPTTDETYVSLEVFFHDLDRKFWSSKIIATKTGPFGWEIKTLPRKPALSLF